MKVNFGIIGLRVSIGVHLRLRFILSVRIGAFEGLEVGVYNIPGRNVVNPDTCEDGLGVICLRLDF